MKPVCSLLIPHGSEDGSDPDDDARRLDQSPRELDAEIWEHERGEAGVI